MSGVSCLALALPHTRLSAIWRLNHTAETAFLSMGLWAPVLLAALSMCCAFSAYGLWRGADWGRRLAVVILLANLIGDTGNAVIRGDLRTLIGLPIGGAMIAYLLSARGRAHFEGRGAVRDRRTRS